LTISAVAGSRAGTEGTSTSPAPNRPRRVDWLEPRLVRLDPRLDARVAGPVDPPVSPVLTGSGARTATAGGAAAVAAGAVAAGAMPHTVQKPSSMLPEQPGRAQAVIMTPCPR
jgi:hypothetical protein